MAKTKAQRLASKRGRKRKEGAREPSGRPSRSGIDHGSPIDAPLKARARRLGISEDKAMDQKAGSFIGYLNIIGPRDGLSDAQYEGAQQYIIHKHRLSRVLQSPAAIYDPEAIGGDGNDPEAYASWCKNVIAVDKVINAQIQEAQNYSRDNLWAALQYVVIEGQELHHMIGATRVLCNVLARHFKTTGENRRAA
jgi:hypothetical protein